MLVVGGYGTVGGDLARLAAPSWSLLLTGRTPEKGQALAEEVGAEVRRWDLGDPEPFSARVRAVISTVNDPDDRVMLAAIRGGVPYVDITRWTARLQRATAVAAVNPPTAPVLLSSSWMGGVSALVTAALAAELGGASGVQIAIRYDLKDRAGTDSVEFMDRLGLDYEVTENGGRRMIMPLSDAGFVQIGEHRTKVARIDTPEQFTLPLVLGLDTAITRIGFSANSSTSTLLALKKTGFFRWGRGDSFEKTRRSMLYSPGEGGSALLRIDVRGRGGELRSAVVEDAAGQAHLTALGGLLGLRRVLGADGAKAPTGVVFPEMTPVPQDVVSVLEKAGVEVTVS
ncbi:saccharopine dehydrogenase [Streptomyces sp. CB02959]|uniref:saccharopine dehydrogenase n=1 Tax=Streptomyces sp. CB02959 TaxID=2020330 RepID=UPI000C2728F0|nr:saccharopine dehydrogenase [Streptomyces sp. CB02959]PJN36170.1 saccharopine dehydrogenase [Streptomyces sp. CB02959]